jgi:hypothetical protein
VCHHKTTPKKQQIAKKEGHCKFERHIMAWPLLQPPAYLVPKLTIKPPMTNKMTPFRLKICSALKSSVHIKPEKSVNPYDCNA